MAIIDTPVKEFKLTAIVVTHNPDIRVLKDLIDALASQTDSIIVIDNHSINPEELATECKRVELCQLPSNMGLGKAHNLGIEYAMSINSTHVLLLDQDSIPDADMIAEQKKSVLKLEREGVRYSGIGCRYHLSVDDDPSAFVKISWFRFSRVHCQNNSPVKADFLISSGTLIPILAIREVGMMDESLFIDHIDTEWFLRAKYQGYDAYGCCTAFMHHALGEKTAKIWFGRSRNVPFHKPFRYYYIFRNSFLLYKRSYMTFKWRVADWVRLIQSFVFFGILSPQRISNLKMMWLGILHGLKGVAGRNDNIKLL